MSTAINPSIAARNIIVDALGVKCNGGVLRIYSGAKPANGDAATGAGTLLAEMTLKNPAFNTAASGSAALNVTGGLADASADATGTAAWYRIVATNSDNVFDGTCGLSGSGESLILSTLSVTSGSPVTITAGTLTANQ